jgi:glycosyltransferase involved in cell wall biosynthesis
MRVLHVIPAVAPRYGGPSIVAIESVRALRLVGCDAMIATTDADGDSRLAIPLGERVEWDGVPLVAFARGGGEGFKWSSGLARWLDRHVVDYDLVDIHAVFSHSSLAAARACRRAGTPYVLRPHGALDPWSLSRKAWQKAALMRLGVRRMLAGAAQLQYTTEQERALAQTSLPWLRSGSVVPLGVDDDCFSDPRTDTSRPYVLTLSRLEEKKSIELLIDAFHELARDGAPVWRLVLAGDGRPTYVGALRARAAAGPAAPHIEFSGWVRGHQKRALVAGASVFASPSAQENFGLSLVEAMASGVPVLVTPGVNLAREIDSAGAGWVVPHDAAALATRLRGIMTGDADRTVRGAAARGLAERFRWSVCVGQLAEFYEDVRARREPGSVRRG